MSKSNIKEWQNMINEVVTLPSHSSTSADINLAKGFLGVVEKEKQNVLFSMHYPNGLGSSRTVSIKQFSEYNEEDEYLVDPRNQFLVKEVKYPSLDETYVSIILEDTLATWKIKLTEMDLQKRMDILEENGLTDVKEWKTFTVENLKTYGFSGYLAGYDSEGDIVLWFKYYPNLK